MKKIFLVLSLFLLITGRGFAQSSWPPPIIAASDPAGACANGVLWVNIITPSLWYCGGSVWSNTSGGGGMVYPGLGIALSTGAGWNTSIAAPDGDASHFLNGIGGWTAPAGGANVTLSNLTNPTAINDTTLTFAGAGGLTALGTNQNITLTPSGTGTLIAPTSVPSLAYTLSVDGSGNIIAKPNNPANPVYTDTDGSVVLKDVLTEMSASCGQIYFKNGTYNLNSVTPAAANLYNVNYYSVGIPNSDCQWFFIGESAPTFHGEVTGTPPTSGVILNVTAAAVTAAGAATNILAALFVVKQTNASNYPFVHVEFRNIAVRFPSNQRGNEWQFAAEEAGEIAFRNTLTDFANSYPTAASAAGNFSYVFPPAARGNVQLVRDAYALGGDTCFDAMSEHLDVNGMTAIYCNRFGTLVGGPHSSTFINLNDQENKNGLKLQSASDTFIIGYDIEQATSGTWTRATNLTETSSGAGGFINYNLVTQGGGLQPCPANIFTGAVPGFVQSCGGVQKIAFIAPSSTQTTITGTTAGTAVCSEPFVGSSYKKTTCFLNGYENTTVTAQTYTFPTAFTNTPYLSKDDTAASAVNTTDLTLPASMGSPVTGWVTVEGY